MSFVLGPAKRAIFDTLDAWTVTKRPKKELGTLLKYQTVHPDDQLPVNLVEPDLDNGPWIAGGACLRWFQNKPVGEHSDIDVFCKDALQVEKILQNINNSGLSVYNGSVYLLMTTKNAVTFEIKANNQKWKLQIITCKYFDTIQDVINHFDITVCQVATTGNEWILGDMTARDINTRSLRFNRITNQSPKRLIKYWSYGFTPVEGTLETVQESVLWDYALTPEYDNAL